MFVKTTSTIVVWGGKGGVNSPRTTHDDVLDDFGRFFKIFCMRVFMCVAGRCGVTTLATQHRGAWYETI